MSILMVGVGFFSIFLLNDCSKKETHDEPSNVNPAVPAGSDAVVIFNDTANFQIVDDALYAITYGNNTYVMGGTGGKIKTSTDGMTWTARTSGTTERIMGFAYGNGIWVAVGDKGTILTSSNGIEWSL
jgi:hypothetical protein